MVEWCLEATVRKISSLTKRVDVQDVAVSGPLYLFLLGVLIVAYVAVLVSNPSIRLIGPLVLFTALMVVHALLHVAAVLLPPNRRWIALYCLVQGAIVFAIGYQTGSSAMILGLYMAMIGECAGLLWPDRRAVALAAAFFVVLLVVNIVVLWGSAALLDVLPMVAGLLAFVLLYVVLYIRQVRAREEAQALARELEEANAQLQAYAGQVQALTIDQERQRMARELHDTLAQGLAGLVLQLEAADSHLEGSNVPRAQELVQQAMLRARETLHGARRAIQDLRPVALEQGGLVDAIGDEVDRFVATTGVATSFRVDVTQPDLSPEVAQDVLRIIQESLSNVGRHAGASQVQVRLAQGGDGLRVVVQDDGAGFDVAEAFERAGCFGMVGMRERAARAGGSLAVESDPGHGTRVTLKLGEGTA
jgi:NarL family two-component system sensor histidine kinase YdfH